MTSIEETAPELENIETTETNNVKDKIKQSKGEKKSRKIISKLGLKQVHDVMRLVITRSKNMKFVINNPEVYKSSNGVEDMNQNLSMAAAERLKNTLPSISNEEAKSEECTKIKKPSEEDIPELVTVKKEPEIDEVLDEEGLDPKEIELVMKQVNVSRNVAVRALKENSGDIVNAIVV
ncbi:NAC-alpha [Intoshia linei]|uniref:NAC-alpha n=1 Tax=Intoshia linei TaxID=1819745 RepID=A0A177BAH4_9BILA|nr:NAC-alpha [Intoshia linei]